MQGDIENVLFSRFLKQNIPFEFLPIEDLYKRVSEQNFDLSIAHRIEFHALIIVLKGEGNHMIDFKGETISAGTILPIRKGQVHSFSKDLNIEGYVIGFEENFITRGINDKNLFHFLQIFHTERIDIGKDSVTILQPFLSIMGNLLEDDNINLKEEIINTTFLTLLLQIKRLACNQHNFFDSQKLKDFYLFKELIIKYHNEVHNAKDYAKKMDVSYNYLNGICKEIVNKTAKEFIDSWLLLEIKRNILENKYNSQEISYKMGFKEPSNFIRFFKRYEKLTPLQFQENLKISSIRD